MPIYDYECDKCGHREEVIHSVHEIYAKICPRCEDALLTRIISASGQYLGNQDAPWLRSVLEVVDKESKAPHVVEFRRNPTRENYRKWMKGEGLRPADDNVRGAPPVYERPQTDTSHIRREVMEKFRQRRRIEVR